MNAKRTAASVLAALQFCSTASSAIDDSDIPLDVLYERAETVAFGFVTSIRSGDCGGRQGVGTASIRIEAVGRGRDIEPGVMVDVCSATRLLIGKGYIVTGEFDEDGRLLADVHGFVMADGGCNRYYRIDFAANPEVAARDGDGLYVIGTLIEGYRERYGPIIGMDLRPFEVPSPVYCELSQ